MTYLQPADYTTFGLTTETQDSWVAAASAMIDAHCRRPTLMSATYTERMRVPGAQTVRLSYTPLLSIDSVRARYTPKPHDNLLPTLQEDIALAFGLPGAWVDVNPASLDISLPTGEFRFCSSVLNFGFSEAEVTYTAGSTTVPDPVKFACAQIVKNMQATPALNVKSSRMDTLQTEYFSDSLLDSNVRALLRPFVAERLG